MPNARTHALESLTVDPDERLIVDRIFSAVMEQRLAPRTKLSEAALCKAFGVGRMRVRRALLLLGSQGIVDLRSNRGAFVSCPGRDDAREVFSARLMIETGIVRKLADGTSDRQIANLRAHIECEDNARDRRDRSDMIRLSGEFHVELAKAHGNSVLTRMVRELVTRTSLIVGLFGRNRESTCLDDEHTQIVTAIEAGDSQNAEKMIRHHLQHIQDGLDLERDEIIVTDIAKILNGS